MHTRAHTKPKCARARFVATKRARARLRFVCARVCMDLYQKKFGSSLLSYELKFQISLRSELSLQRYLQNCTDFQKSSIFNVFSIFSQLFASKVFKDGLLLKSCGIFGKLDIKMET